MTVVQQGKYYDVVATTTNELTIERKGPDGQSNGHVMPFMGACLPFDRMEWLLCLLADECDTLRKKQDVLRAENDVLQSQNAKLRAVLKKHLHTQECVDYSVKTALACGCYNCIAQCADSRREAEAT